MKKWISWMLALVMALSVAAFAAGEQDLSTMVVELKEADSYRKELSIALASQITTLDPGLISNVQHYYLFNMVYDTLLFYDNIKKELSGKLATSFEWADDTYTKIHIVLRDDVVFHNGEKLTADDVAFSLGRTTSTLVTNSFDHVDVISPTELDIVLKAPNVDFLYVLSHNSSAIVSKKAVEENPDLGGAIGSGPWIIDMANYVAGDTIALVRNDAYWGELPKTEKIRLRLIANASSRLVALQNREVSLMTSINTTEIMAAKANSALTVYEFPTAQMYYLAFNNTNGPAADNLKLRQAIAYAINREDLYLGTGDEGASPATSFWGWHMKYYFDQFDLDLSYNPEKAKELVAEIGGTPTLKLMVNTTSDDYRIMFEIIQDACRKVGIDIVLEEVDSAGATANSKYKDAKHEAMLYSINMNDWDSDMGRLLSVNSNTNKAVLNNERVTELLALGVSTTDEAQRREYYKELQILIHDNCFYIPLYYTSDTTAFEKDAGGMRLSYSRDHDYSYIAIPEK